MLTELSMTFLFMFIACVNTTCLLAKVFKGAKMSVSTLVGCLAIAASVLYIGRDRSVSHGRREDELIKKLTDMEKQLKQALKNM